MSFSFGQSTPAASSAGGGLFGSTAPASTSTPLFGATAAAPSTAPLFGSATPAASTAPAAGLFGAPQSAAPALGTGSLFGSTPSATTASMPLFGAATAPATTSTPLFGATASPKPATGGLFGAAAPATGSLFGSPSTTAAMGGLFGATTTTPATTFAAPAPAPSSVGLGGNNSHIQQTLAAATIPQADPEKEKAGVKEGDVPPVLLNTYNEVRKKLDQQQALIRKFEIRGDDGTAEVDAKIRQLTTRLDDLKQRMNGSQRAAEATMEEIGRDEQMIRVLCHANRAVTPISTKHTQHVLISFMEHLVAESRNRVDALEKSLTTMIEQVNAARNGHHGMDVEALKAHLERFDHAFTGTANRLFEYNQRIEMLKDDFLRSDPRLALSGRNPFTKIRNTEPEPPISSFEEIRGPEVMPNNATLLRVSQLIHQAGQQQPAATAVKPTTGTTGFFGSLNTQAAPSLFGSTTTAAKPLFGSTGAAPSSGSLFGSPSAGASTSLFGATATSTAAPTTSSSASFFPSFSTPTTSTATAANNAFGKHITTQSSGLLFSSKPFGK
ncbi:unnamed protein product, partial [Mesorhabditis spiculigera]